MPVFNKQFYSDIVPENIELHSPLSVAIQAESPLGRKLIYTIVKGNELEEFAVDFNTGKKWTKKTHRIKKEKKKTKTVAITEKLQAKPHTNKK